MSESILTKQVLIELRNEARREIALNRDRVRVTPQELLELVKIAENANAEPQPTYAVSEEVKEAIAMLRRMRKNYEHQVDASNKIELVCSTLESSLRRIAELEQENRALKEKR